MTLTRSLNLTILINSLVLAGCGGALSIQPPTTAAFFRQLDKGIQVEVDTYESPDKPTDVRLDYYTNPLLVPCNKSAPGMTDYAESIAPLLTLPANVVLLGDCRGGGLEGWAYSQRDVLTDMSPSDLDQFLRPQLQKAGWQLVAQSQTDPVAWSKWKLTDPRAYVWSGVLIITAGQGSQNSRIVLFQIERVV